MCVITGWPAPLTVGGVQTFLSYANQYTKPFNEVTNVITQLQTAYASARRLFALLDADEESPEKADREALAAPAVPSVGSALPAEFARPAQLAGPASSARGEVVFDHVNFSYTPERPLLQDICIHAAPGQRIAPGVRHGDRRGRRHVVARPAAAAVHRPRHALRPRDPAA